MPSSPTTARAKRTVQRPKPRQKNSTSWKNFRDHRKSVDGPLLALLCNLQRKHGWSYVSEAGLQQMICEDTEHMPGEDTVRRALDRLENKHGQVHQIWLRKGGVLPDGRVAHAGCRLIRVAMSRAERNSFFYEARARAKRKQGRLSTDGRLDPPVLFDLMTGAQKNAAPSPQPSHVGLDASNAAAAALMASWAAQGLDPNTGQPPS